MKLLSHIASTAGTNLLSSSRGVFRVLAAFALSLGLATASQAAPITGDPQTNVFSWTPNSTNALNYAQLVPGREGQIAPYVLFSSNGVGSVTLDFFNLAPGVAFFETRIDNIETGVTVHPVVIGDTIHTGGTFLAANTQLLDKTFSATDFVDIRLALGGERDWDFDWTRFEVQSSSAVPEPGTLGLLALGLLGAAAARRRRIS